MLTSTQLRSPVFDRLTDRLKPKLTHPTALTFDFEEWARIISDDDLGERDLHLLRAARYLAECLRSVRTGLVDGLFDGLTGDQIVDLAIANANRAWNIFRWKLGRAMPQLSDRMQYIPALGKLEIPVGPGGAMLNCDDANNALVDSLPYWFDEAAKAPRSGVDHDADKVGEVMHWGHVATNLMQVFRSVWQEVLWEPYGFTFDEVLAEVFPLQRHDLARWKAWAWREETLVAQSSLLNRNLERNIKELPFALPLTAIGIEADGIAVGKPSDMVAASHRSALENLQKSYVQPFLSDPIGANAEVTITVLEKAVCVLQDVVGLCLDRRADPKDLDQEGVVDFRCAFPRRHLEDLLVHALGIAPEAANVCLDIMSADPFGNLGPLFTQGLWHRPLVRSRDGRTIMIVAGALVWGSPIRRAERWLQSKVRNSDLSETSAGIQYEETLRANLAEALDGNELFAKVPHGVSSVSEKEGEEIDLLLRIGSTLIVGEIKCLLQPAEPIDRYGYVNKLQNACAQARRKTEWLKRDPASLESRFGEDARKLRLQPLVIVNQSCGVEWEYDGCPITDARFIRLFCGSGSYLFGGKLFDEAGRSPELFGQIMYESAAAAEAAIPQVFRKMPGMDAFRDSVIWGQSDVPLPNDNLLRLQFARADVDAYVAFMDYLLSGASDQLRPV